MNIEERNKIVKWCDLTPQYASLLNDKLNAFEDLIRQNQIKKDAEIVKTCELKVFGRKNFVDAILNQIGEDK